MMVVFPLPVWPTRATLALLHMKIHMLEHKDILFIGERDVVELHIAADLRQHCGAGGVLHLDRFVDHLKDTLQICHVVDEVVVDVGKLVDGPQNWEA